MPISISYDHIVLEGATAWIDETPARTVEVEVHYHLASTSTPGERLTRVPLRQRESDPTSLLQQPFDSSQLLAAPTMADVIRVLASQMEAALQLKEGV
ncbi:MAG: hypothetical protein ACE5IG_06120 [Dehalococcoidia bacterium]